jgi:ubiquinone/menaquinone biosynthesis C-methylase UbiE
MITFAKIKHFDDPEFEKWRKKLEEYHNVERSMSFDWCRQWEYTWVMKNSKFKKTDRVVDAGGGYCYFPCIVSDYVKEVVVIDKNIKSLNHCFTFFPKMYVQSLENLDIKEKFDKVVCVSVIEHIEEWDKALVNITKILKNKGYLYMTMNVDFDNKRNLHYDDVEKAIKILKKNDMDLGKIDLTVNDVFTKNELMKRNISLPELDNVNELNYGILGIIAQKNEKL